MLKKFFGRFFSPPGRAAVPVKILIVEDNPIDAKMIKKAVETSGHIPLLAVDGKTGIEMAKVQKPGLIILDYNLPDINGGQVLEALRSNKDTSSGTVMMLTILKSPDVVVHSFMQGADQYLTKPISVSALAQQIKVMLEPPGTEA